MKNIIANQVDSIFILVVVISVVLIFIVTGSMIYFMFRYNKKRNPRSTEISGNTTLEVLWTVIPTLLVLVIFYYGLIGFDIMRNPPADAMVVQVNARQWSWNFEYANKKTSDTLLFLPVGKPVKFEIHSADVIHSFYIAAFRVKEDAVPGRTNYLWFLPDKTGEFWIECTAYCGLNHSYMRGKVVVMPVDDFNKWYNTAVPNDTTKTIPDTTKMKMDSTQKK